MKTDSSDELLSLDQAKQQRLDENPYSANSLDDSSYATFEMRHNNTASNTLGSRRKAATASNTLKSSSATLRSTRSKASAMAGGGGSNFAMISGARQPPRPVPSLVRYSDEDDSAKGYDENPDDDSDSLTEKPSEISSTDSQVMLATSGGIWNAFKGGI